MTTANASRALWNDVTPAHEEEYNDWHAYEHVPERLTMPGFVWARRWRAAGDVGPGPRYLTLYGLASPGALDTPQYQRLLAGPTPWSQRMRPHLLHLSRWACMVEAGSDAAAGSSMQAVCLQAAPALMGEAHLRARRRHDAAPLPWLAGTQAQDIPGDWLVCGDTITPLPDELYRRDFLRLPVGRDNDLGASRWPAVAAR